MRVSLVVSISNTHTESPTVDIRPAMTDSSRRLGADSTCKFANFISAAFTQLLGKLMHPPDNDDVINAKSQIPLVGQENQENLCL